MYFSFDFGWYSFHLDFFFLSNYLIYIIQTNKEHTIQQKLKIYIKILQQRAYNTKIKNIYKNITTHALNLMNYFKVIKLLK